ncbi:MAG: hypothetical protein KC519_13495, partial [Anaerolineae bacterium]|nr:hypothetical protein [Anaerolineae bacterium]
SEFLKAYDLSEPPRGDSWIIIWSRIERAVPEVKRLAQAIPQPVATKTKRTPQTDLLLRIAITLALLSLIGFVVSIRSQEIADLTCLSPVAWTPPPFIRDEGFSLYLPVPDDPLSGIINANVRTVGHDTTGIWVGYVPDGNFDGVSHLKRGSFEWLHCPGLGLSTNQNVNAFATYNDSLFVATDGGGIGQLDENTWRMYTTNDGLPSMAVFDFLVDASNKLYASTLEGVARYEAGRWQTVYVAEIGGLTNNRITKMLYDSAGNRWFGTIDQGIDRLSPDGSWTTYYRNDPGLRFARAIEEDAAGNIWFGTDAGGLLKFTDGAWRVFSIESGHLPSDSIQDVEYDARYDRVWIATPSGALYSADGGETWTTHISRNTWAMEIGCTNGCAYDDNHIWFVFRDGGIGHSQLPPNRQIVEIVEAPGRVQLVPGEEYVFSVKVRVLAEDLANGDGLFVIEPDGADLYGAWERIPIPPNVIVELGQDWTFTNVQNPIIAPETPGLYELAWRIWQNGRYVTEPIVVEFEVVDS